MPGIIDYYLMAEFISYSLGHRMTLNVEADILAGGEGPAGVLGLQDAQECPVCFQEQQEWDAGPGEAGSPCVARRKLGLCLGPQTLFHLGKDIFQGPLVSVLTWIL